MNSIRPDKQPQWPQPDKPNPWPMVVCFAILMGALVYTGTFMWALKGLGLLAFFLLVIGLI